ncbi:MAG TPA: hypothetical protein VFQ35_25070, partial [Polyangiaceae bacterium]|nr:hypothetical protein [Polyangiaceae bacterium]
ASRARSAGALPPPATRIEKTVVSPSRTGVPFALEGAAEALAGGGATGFGGGPMGGCASGRELGAATGARTAAGRGGGEGGSSGTLVASGEGSAEGALDGSAEGAGGGPIGTPPKPSALLAVVAEELGAASETSAARACVAEPSNNSTVNAIRAQCTAFTLSELAPPLQESFGQRLQMQARLAAKAARRPSAPRRQV